MLLNIFLLLLLSMHSHGKASMPSAECGDFAPVVNLVGYRNNSGYMYCVSPVDIIPQSCSSGTEVLFKLGGCVNKTTNTTVFPVGSRCASQPCQNGVRCFDLSLADAYYCSCSYPYTGFHCHIQVWGCPPPFCGVRTPEMIPQCYAYSSDRALRYSCRCYMPDYIKPEYSSSEQLS